MRPNLRRLLTALLVLEVLYTIAANGFLHSPLFDVVVNGDPEKVEVRTKWALSLFPGWVIARSIQVQGQDSKTQWQVEVKRARVWVSLPDLFLRKNFHVTKLDAKNASFQVQSHSSAERSQGGSGLKQIQIDQVHIPELNELWMGPYQFNGIIDVTGAFVLNLGHQLEITRGRLEIRSGSVSQSNRSITQNLSGIIEGNVRDYSFDRETALDIFKTLSAKIVLQGRLDSLDPLFFVLRNQDWFHLISTRGNFSIDASIRDGKWASVPSAFLVADSLMASFSHFKVQGGAKIRFEMTLNGQGSFDFHVPQYLISSDQDQETVAHGRDLKIVLESPDMDLAHFYRRVIARVKLKEAQIVHFDLLNRWIPQSSDLSVKNGSGEVSADFSVANFRQSLAPLGWVKIKTDHLQVQKGPDTIVGSVQSTTKIRQVYHEQSSAKELEISGSEIHVTGKVVSKSKPWIADLSVVRGFIRPDNDPEIEAQVKIRAPDLAPLVNEFGIQSGFGKIAQNLLASGKFEGTTNLTLGKRWIHLDQARLISDSSQVFGVLHLSNDSKQGLALVHCLGLSVGIQIDQGDSHLHLLGADEWYKKELIKVEASSVH